MLVNGHILIPDTPDWSTQPEIERLWKTEIAEALPGNEARKTVEFAPRLKLSFTVRQQHAIPQQEFEDTLREALKTGLACVPLHGMAAVLVSQDGAAIVVDAIQEGWRADEYLFFSDQDPEDPSWEVRQIVSIAGTTITLESALDMAWPAGALVWRLIFGRLSSPTQQDAWDYWNGKSKLTLTEREGSTFQGLGDLLFFDPHCYFIDGTPIAVEGTDTVYPSSYACVGGWNWCESGGPFVPSCGRVRFDPASGQAVVPCDVSLSVAPTSEGPPAIHYTTNGKTPTANSPLYSTPIHLSAAATIKAQATRERFYDGPVSTASYGLTPHVDPPIVPPDPIEFVDNTTVEIIPVPDTNTRYTTDGTDPTKDSPLVDGPIPITEDTTIKVITETDEEISAPAIIEFVKADPIFIPSFIGWSGNQWHIRLAATIPAGGVPVTAIFIYPLDAQYSRGEPILVGGGGPVPIYVAGVQYCTGYVWNQRYSWGTTTTLLIGGQWYGDWGAMRSIYPLLASVVVDGVPVNTGFQATLTTLPEGEYDIDLYGTCIYTGFTAWRGVIIMPDAVIPGKVKPWRFDILP